ncbi:hypothetical protein ACFSKI_10715 [Pseudogracilibacillus auburnensis]|uniref:hypothetical protein n=1 Tax=Pseudogracilibacillus auburnensis TaxID=1494959 RepID=UPI001314EE2C|nr:hypothetical protein [Pseudogracilibacillus auburnensis]MBO1001760.1 hypothetical protein [Pseudogracilibacillus auburnensis]
MDNADPGSGYYIESHQDLRSVFDQLDQLAPRTGITSLMMDGKKVTEPIFSIHQSSLSS